MKKKFSNSGLTLIEIIVVILIFSLFMLVIYSTIDLGFKLWKLGEVSSDIQTKSESVLRRIFTELRNANSSAIVFNEPDDPNSLYHSDTPYLCFDTPLSGGEVQYKQDSGDILWQGFILYYALEDPDDTAMKILYRRYIPHNPSYPHYSTDCLTPGLADPNDALDWITVRPPLAVTGDGQSLSICSKISDVKFDYKSCTVKIEMEFREKIKRSKGAKVTFEGGDSTYKFRLETSVKPVN